MNFQLDSLGIHRSPNFVSHRNDEYDEHAFRLLSNMQHDHFWYKGRHKFTLDAIKQSGSGSTMSAIDLGGGVGGWAKYLHESPMRGRIGELALGDSSQVALLSAKEILPPVVTLYQIDLMKLEWENRWDFAFLLDVIEHCPDDVTVMREAAKSLKPGGRLIVTTPALDCFWSHNDVIARHLRRYNKAKYEALARDAGLILRESRYFMFFLSPLYWLSRKFKSSDISEEQLRRAVEKEHRIPSRFVNGVLTAIFRAESPLGHHLHFPWGTSILGVFEKPGVDSN
jgi:SAM-dependent methyltransferase